MKKVFSMIVACVMLASLLTVFASAAAWDGTSTAEFTGTGTAADPFIIASAENLAFLAKSVNEGNEYKGLYFTQTADIDLGGKEWTPIGSGNKPFTGVYDGKGHAVRNLKITVPTVYSGLFGFVGSRDETPSGLVNLSIDGEITVSNSAAKCWVGSFVGLANNNQATPATFANLTSDVKITFNETANKQSNVGGIFGESRWVIAENLVNNGTLKQTGDSYLRLAGITGYTYGSTFTACVNNGDVTAEEIPSAVSNTFGVAAGIAGQINGNAVTTKIVNCVNNGKITAKTTGQKNINYAGGIAAIVYIGSGNLNMEFTDCLNTGDVYSEIDADASHNTYSAGIVPVFEKGDFTISGCVNSGSITYKNKGNYSGGIYGILTTDLEDIIIRDNITVGAARGADNVERTKIVYTNNTENASADDVKGPAAAIVDKTGKFAAIKINGYPTDVLPKPDDTTGEDPAGTDPTDPGSGTTPETGDSAYVLLGVIAVTGIAAAAAVSGKRREDRA